MELIYMYIKKYENNSTSNDKNHLYIENIGINFSENFHCTYNKEKQFLIENINRTFPNFYGNNIKSVKALVGENGTGKTTLLDLLGMTRDDRCSDHLNLKLANTDSILANQQLFKSEYYFVYHYKNNQFIFEFTISENNLSSLFSNWNYASHPEKQSLFRKMPVGVIVDFDFKNKSIIIQDNYYFNDYTHRQTDPSLINNKVNEKINFYYFSNKFSKRHLNGQKITKCRKSFESYPYLLKRQPILIGKNEPSDYKYIYKALKDEKFDFFSKKILKVNPSIKIKYTYDTDTRFLNFESTIPSEAKYAIDKKLSIVFNNFLEKFFSIDDDECLTYIKRSLVSATRESIKASIIHLYENYGESALEVDSIKIKISESFLNNLLINFTDCNFEEFQTTNIFNFIKTFKLFCEFIDSIDDNLIEVNSSLQLNNINCFGLKQLLLINRLATCALFEIMNLDADFIDHSVLQLQFSLEKYLNYVSKISTDYFSSSIIKLDANQQLDEDIISLFDFLQESFEDNIKYNISSKLLIEVTQLSDGESVMLEVFSKLLNIFTEENKGLHLVLLDEPDRGFHPDWSKKLIYLLIQVIDSIFNDRNGKVQLILSTHSPFILSDLKNEDIIVLDSPNKEDRKLKLSDKQFKTFGANIHDILSDAFFFKGKPYGDFAYKKMKQDLEILNYSDETIRSTNNDILYEKLNTAKNLIEIIGEPVLKEALKKEYAKIQSTILEKTNDIIPPSSKLIREFDNLDHKSKKQFLKELLSKLDEEGVIYD